MSKYTNYAALENEEVTVTIKRKHLKIAAEALACAVLDDGALEYSPTALAVLDIIASLDMRCAAALCRADIEAAVDRYER